MQGMLTDIQRFSLHDGPGIRTTVFLKGCPLRCAWCHNPECIAPSIQLRYKARLCTGCGACVQACPHGVHRMEAGHHAVDFSRCIACGNCTRACPVGTLSLEGFPRDTTEVMAEVLRDRKYYVKSGGGLTISGGEPFMQADFTLGLLQAARAENVHTCVETCLFTAATSLLAALPLTGLFLVDWKLSDPAKHRAYTGQDNRRIRENLGLLHGAGAAIRLRCPIIPGINDDEAHLDGIAALLEQYPRIQAVELMAYHHMGVDKYAQLGLPYALPDARDLPPDRQDAVLAALKARVQHPVSWS